MVSQYCLVVPFEKSISAVFEQLLQAMRFWFANLQRLPQLVNAAKFTSAVALNQAHTMRQIKEEDARVDWEVVAKAPDKFKNVATWKIFAQALETYLGQLMGSGRVIPLIHNLKNPTPGTMFETE
jgi:hypothetical protein